MFGIRCLTTGEFIQMDYTIWSQLIYHAGKIPAEVLNNIELPQMGSDSVMNMYQNHAKELLKFNTEEAAQWFINRRLTYNPRRKDFSKLSLMESIFDFNGLPEVTVKVEFEVVEIE